MQQQPAALAYAAALDAQTMAAAADAGRVQIDVVATEQQRIAGVLAGPPFNATEIFRVRRVMNAIAATVDTAGMRALGSIPGVKTVRALEREYPTTSTSVPFVGAPSLWANTIGLNLPGRCTPTPTARCGLPGPTRPPRGCREQGVCTRWR